MPKRDSSKPSFLDRFYHLPKENNVIVTKEINYFSDDRTMQRVVFSFPDQLNDKIADAIEDQILLELAQ